ncbi:DUF3492 domain-containing protein [Streptomyces sp. NBC_01795]|uniref:DUF3492 domain-containing protein n=1 Tax=Streptomyces sp. NBC_01795 TaxID=2975943 RepID=UPI002DD8D724|nr:DUF3492 domain-containing protein [Streptomyces sp. NBC_01795]WSA92504.1 DUF3492 domain-containing protein [Streptomyces sp. NBC_01795]
MRIALLTEGGYPYARGESALWCERLLRGLESHEFEVYALSRSARQEDAGWRELPGNVARVRTAPLWGAGPAGAGARGAAFEGSYGRRERRRFREHFSALAEAICTPETDDPGEQAAATRASDVSGGSEGPGRASGGSAGTAPSSSSAAEQADRFAAGLYGLAQLAGECGGLASALRSEHAVRILESACRAPGALRAVHSAQVSDLLAVTERLERALRPLSLDWYGTRDGDPGLSAADLCHAVGGGPAALPGLLAKRVFGVPLLITEYGVRLREHYLASAAGAVAPAVAGAPVRALLASFQGRLVKEAYAQAQLITPGNAHARRWQERCGARPERLRTVYPGMDATPFEAVGEQATDLPPSDGPRRAGVPTLVWVGRSAPAKDLIALLHAFARVRELVPGARLRLVDTGAADERLARVGRGEGASGDGYLAHCRALAARLFPDEAPDDRSEGTSPVSFEELGSPGAPTLADAYAAGDVVALSSVVEGFPVSLVEAMFCGRATVSTDVGAVCEAIGGTGLVVPPRNPRALGDACAALLCDPARAARLGAAARARALELFTVRQNVEAFRGIYLELMSHCPVNRQESGRERGAAPEDGTRLFARPAESHVPGRWASAARRAVTAGGRRAPGSRPERPTGTRSQDDDEPHVPSWARPEGAVAEREERGGRTTGAGAVSAGAHGAGAEACAPVAVGADAGEAKTP